MTEKIEFTVRPEVQVGYLFEGKVYVSVADTEIIKFTREFRKVLDALLDKYALPHELVRDVKQSGLKVDRDCSRYHGGRDVDGIDILTKEIDADGLL